MTYPSHDEVAGAVADAIRQLLEQSQDAPVPGLGVFAVAQHSGRIEEGEDGNIILHPPRNVVVFRPDSE
jgi:nucleoid DNA-binding protein